jgi:BASS family bile acid:Na+ symporter
LGTSKASNYIRQEMSFSDLIIYEIAIASLLLCISYFLLGRIVTEKEFQIEGGQSLGQKNNGFTIWIALTFISPLAVLGPVFYILFQNLYISWQLHKHNIGINSNAGLEKPNQH